VKNNVAYLKLGKYWQHSIREGGRVTVAYFGSGDGGALMAGMAALAREERQAERLERRAAEALERRRLEEERARGRALRMVVAATLGQMGYARYDRGRWKRRKSMPKLSALPARRDVSAGVPAPPGPAAIKALKKRVRDRSPGAYAELEELARVHPCLVADQFSDLAWVARAALSRKIAGRDPIFDLGIAAGMERKIAELVGESTSPAVRHVAEAAGFCWGWWWSIAAWLATYPEQTTPLLLRRQQVAHRLYMSSLKTYEQISVFEGYVGARATAARLAAAAALTGPPDE
jgi:hypothetical protein